MSRGYFPRSIYTSNSSFFVGNENIYFVLMSQKSFAGGIKGTGTLHARADIQAAENANIEKATEDAPQIPACAADG